MFESFDNSKSPIFIAGMRGFFVGAVLVSITFGISVALSEDAESQYYALVAAILGAFLGSIVGAIMGIIIGAFTFARRRNS